MTEEIPKETKVRLIPSTRLTLALLVSFALFTQYAQRVSLTMGIVCMVDRTSKTSTTSDLLSFNQTTVKINTKLGSTFLGEKRFPWTELQQQILLGAYWFGYIFTLVPSGWLAISWGAKKLFTLSLLFSSIATFAIPTIYFIDTFHFYVALVFRAVIGFTHGPLFPATYALWAMWAVPAERSTLTSIGFCSNNMGTSVTMLIGGVLCRYVTSGWIYIFILTSIFGFIWLPLWLWFVADSPLIHPRIDEKEKNYICQALQIDEQHQKKKSAALGSLPWGRIVKSKPVIALFVTECFNLFGLFFFYTNVGKILTEIHRIPSQYAGYVLAGGFILMPICSLGAGIIADQLVAANILRLTNVRKLFNSIASFIPAVCMIVLCFCDHTNQILGIVTILIFLATSATAYGSGYIVNFVDVLPACSSILFGISTAISTVGALIANLIAGLVIREATLNDWRKLFILFCIIYILGGLVFLVWGSGRPRSWATHQAMKENANAQDTSADIGEEMTPMKAAD